MTAKQAVVARVKELLEERHITTNTAANEAGVSPSTLYSILGKKSRNPGVVTIQILCDGLGISLREFFDSPLFENLEQEIK